MQQSPTYPQQQNVPAGRETAKQQGMMKENVIAEQLETHIAGNNWNAVWTGAVFSVASFALLTSLLQGFNFIVSGTPTTLTTGGVWWEVLVLAIAYYAGGYICGQTTSVNQIGNVALYGSAVWALFSTVLVTIILAGAHALFQGHAIGNASISEISWGMLSALVLGYITCTAGALSSSKMAPREPRRRP